MVSILGNSIEMVSLIFRHIQHPYTIAIKAVQDPFQEYIAVDDITLTESDCEPVWNNDFEHDFGSYQQDSGAPWKIGDSDILGKSYGGQLSLHEVANRGDLSSSHEFN